MNWTLDQLQAFVTAANTGSFSAAARKLGKAQSRVSTAISNLEADLGFELFDRTSRLPTLTEFGKEMLSEAQAILTQCDRMNARAFSAAQNDEIALVFACDEAVPIVAFHTIFERISERFPDLKLTVINGSRDDIATAVMEQRADFGLMFRSSHLPAAIEFHSIGHFHQVLVVAKNHPLADINEPEMSDLQAYRQLVICDRTGIGRDEALTANHWHIDSYFLICEMVIKQLGWAFVPEHVANSNWYNAHLNAISSVNVPHSRVIEVGLIKRRDKEMKKATYWITDQLSRMFEEADLNS
uniref:LysR family transcriptional regulator n=1 Tax=Thaumasiovibrio occultus TaxID=1891184 RepID=UPI000B356428|nr:LysR family transcriptional regulator [Thaumasiovibrio occultus]